VTIAMLGPEVSWYLGVAAFLFATGALGVLLRRSPLIVLLSLEIMLNGGNLALIAFSRNQGRGDGQIFAITAFVAFRLAFSAINDSLGAQPDAQLAQSLPPEVREAVTYGRPVAQATAT